MTRRTALLACLLAAPAAGAAAPAPVEAALARALAVPGGRVELVDWQPGLAPACLVERAETARPVTASGRVALRLSGQDRGLPCQGTGWARVRVLAPALRATRLIRTGEPLAGASGGAEAEVRAGHEPVGALPEGAVATRTIVAGALLDPADLQVGPRPGEPLTVRLRSGALLVEQSGRALPCPRGRACALLPSGRRVEGRLEAGRLLVELP